jgi:hypothetical protein
VEQQPLQSQLRALGLVVHVLLHLVRGGRGLMFICEPCHTKANDCQMGFIEGFMRSRGRCEMCGDVAACLDCHGYKAKPLPEPCDCPACHIPDEEPEPEPEPEPQICGRCMSPVPCGCYSHESRLGLPFPSSTEAILEAYATQFGEQFGQLVRIKQLVRDPFWQAEMADNSFLDKLKEILGEG